MEVTEAETSSKTVRSPHPKDAGSSLAIILMEIGRLSEEDRQRGGTESRGSKTRQKVETEAEREKRKLKRKEEGARKREDLEETK